MTISKNNKNFMEHSLACLPACLLSHENSAEEKDHVSGHVIVTVTATDGEKAKPAKNKV